MVRISARDQQIDPVHGLVSPVLPHDRIPACRLFRSQVGIAPTLAAPDQVVVAPTLQTDQRLANLGLAICLGEIVRVRARGPAATVLTLPIDLAPAAAPDQVVDLAAVFPAVDQEMVDWPVAGDRRRETSVTFSASTDHCDPTPVVRRHSPIVLAQATDRGRATGLEVVTDQAGPAPEIGPDVLVSDPASMTVLAGQAIDRADRVTDPADPAIAPTSTIIIGGPTTA